MAEIKPYPRRLTTKFKTGKHAGKTLQEVIDSNIEDIKRYWRDKIIAMDTIAFDYFLEKAGNLKTENKVRTNIYKRHIRRK